MVLGYLDPGAASLLLLGAVVLIAVVVVLPIVVLLKVLRKPKGTSAGWQPDPTEPGQLRWWDGRQWTGHVAPAAGPSGPSGPADNPPVVTPPATTDGQS